MQEKGLVSSQTCNGRRHRTARALHAAATRRLGQCSIARAPGLTCKGGTEGVTIPEPPTPLKARRKSAGVTERLELSGRQALRRQLSLDEWAPDSGDAAATRQDCTSTQSALLAQQLARAPIMHYRTQAGITWGAAASGICFEKSPASRSIPTA